MPTDSFFLTSVMFADHNEFHTLRSLTNEG
jgi:hypothetical protein